MPAFLHSLYHRSGLRAGKQNADGVSGGRLCDVYAQGNAQKVVNEISGDAYVFKRVDDD